MMQRRCMCSSDPSCRSSVQRMKGLASYLLDHDTAAYHPKQDVTSSGQAIEPFAVTLQPPPTSRFVPDLHRKMANQRYNSFAPSQALLRSASHFEAGRHGLVDLMLEQSTLYIIRSSRSSATRIISDILTRICVRTCIFPLSCCPLGLP